MTIATQIADTIVADLRKAITDDPKFTPRVWTAPGLNHARIYTGSRGEHLRVYPDGHVERSQSRMSWGHLIDAVLAADPMAPA
jgi:hypothetical protein